MIILLDAYTVAATLKRKMRTFLRPPVYNFIRDAYTVATATLKRKMGIFLRPPVNVQDAPIYNFNICIYYCPRF